MGDADEDDDPYSFLNTDNLETTDEESTLLQQVLQYYCSALYREEKCANTTGTVLVPWAGHFLC